jgi:hypothetical protein
MEGIKAPASVMGRAVTEVFAKSKVNAPERKVRTVQTRTGSYCAQVQLSSAGDHAYVDLGQRCP